MQKKSPCQYSDEDQDVNENDEAEDKEIGWFGQRLFLRSELVEMASEVVVELCRIYGSQITPFFSTLLPYYVKLTVRLCVGNFK